MQLLRCNAIGHFEDFRGRNDVYCVCYRGILIIVVQVSLLVKDDMRGVVSEKARACTWKRDLARLSLTIIIVCATIGLLLSVGYNITDLFRHFILTSNVARCNLSDCQQSVSRKLLRKSNLPSSL